jgi:hypothetical protein
VGSIVVPLVVALIGTATSLVVVDLQDSSHAAGGKADSPCEVYEKYVLYPIAKNDPKAAEKMAESGSAIDRRCGLSR